MTKNYRTIFGEKVFLTDEKWAHISNKHPEVKRFNGKIKEVLSSPDIVKISKRNSSVQLYYKIYENIFNGKYLLVIVGNEKKIVLTAFITDKIKVGEVLWQKK